MKCFRYFSFALFVLLGVFFGSFIINQNNTYAQTESHTFYDDQIYNFNPSFVPKYFIFTYTVPDQFSSSSYNIRFYVSNSDVSSSQYNSCYFYFAGTSKSYSSDYLICKNKFTSNPGRGYYAAPASYSGSPFSVITSGFTLTYTDDDIVFGGSTPSGSIELTENGTYDVSQYAEAVVNVPETDCPPSSGGDYHEDLVAINNSIMICAATCLVIYFFYCIYRMIIKNSGVK